MNELLFWLLLVANAFTLVAAICANRRLDDELERRRKMEAHLIEWMREQEEINRNLLKEIERRQKLFYLN